MSPLKAIPLTLLDNPPYVVDFQGFVPIPAENAPVKRLLLASKTSQVARRALELTGILFISFAVSLSETVRYSWTGFKIIVFHYHGSLADFRPPLSASLAIFRVFSWAVSLVEGVARQTATRFTTKAFPVQHSISSMLLPYGKEMNLAHLRCQDTSIDVSNVPATVQVNDLLKLFDEANFSNRALPGYVCPATGTENLREQLKKLVNYVNNRTPCLGTPPASDIPRLLSFYQHIENAICFSIHKVNEDLRIFKEANPGDFADYDEEKQNKYKDLLENRARVALDLAVAGGACGARWMGEADTVYSNCSEKNVIQEGVTLENSLIEILARKRKEIALAEIERHGKGDTHYYGKYFQNMGQLLGLPDTKNIIEHLSTYFDLPLHLKAFFQTYTVDCMIDTINEAMKKSQPFRESIYDWIKDQVKDWKKEDYEELAEERIGQIEKIAGEKIKDSLIPAALENFSQLVTAHKDKLPKAVNATQFLEAFVELEEVKNAACLSIIQPLLVDSEVIEISCKDHLYKHALEGAPLDPAYFFRNMIIFEIREVVPILKTTQVEGFLRQPAIVPILIKDLTHQERAAEFQEAFPALEAMTEEGLPPELIEWVIVSHRILHPQLQELPEEQGRGPVCSDTEQYIKTVKDLAPKWLSDYADGRNIDSSRETAIEILKAQRESKKRWYAQPADPEQALLRAIFLDTFQANSREILASAGKVIGSPTPLYPRWKDRILSTIDIMQAFYFKTQSILSIALIVFKWKIYYKYYAPMFDRLEKHVTESTLFHLLPRVINYAPLAVIRAGNQVSSAINYATSNKISLLFKLWMIQSFVPIPALRNFLGRISLLNAGIFLCNLSKNPLDREKSAFRAGVYTILESLFSNVLKKAKYPLIRLTQEEQEKRRLINQEETYRLFINSLNSRTAAV